MPVATYQVELPAFSGPFDLLLQLIARHQVDIWEIPIATITDDYLAALGALDQVDLESASEFLVVAATLVELKAARLLPDEPEDDPDEEALEARDLLYARLLEYRLFKEAAGHLQARMEASLGFVPRQAPLESRFAGLRPDLRLPLDAASLAALAARVLADAPPDAVDLSHVQPVRISVREAAGMVLDELARAGGRLTFAELTAGCRHPAEVVVHFLALLELYRSEHVDLDQRTAFGELAVAARQVPVGAPA